MADQIISTANLSYIENSLSTINRNIHTLNETLEVVDARVDRVSSEVQTVYSELKQLATDFSNFIKYQEMENELQKAETRLTKIRQEMEKKYGHHDIVRRTTTGILQANDLQLVKKETISTATEELMLSTPGYWLVPNLVALASWINNQPEVAERALLEGIRRNDAKTSLFWALVCRRSDRKPAALKWTQRYLANQDETNLDRVTIIILDAFASGLLGSDSEGVVSKQMATWLEHLAAEPGFVEKQTQQWSDAINLKRKPLGANNYTYLRQYSSTWPVLQDVMEGAYLHAEILNYFISIFEQEASTAALKVQLDEILNDLVTEYDDEELPLRKEEKLNQFIVDFGGDVNRAKQHMQIEQTAFEEHKDFTQLLTDAAMKPESSHSSVSTQKFAIALSKPWITNAYNDVVAKNRAKFPYEIAIDVDTFHDKTTNGQNEADLLGRFNAHVEAEKANALAQCELSAFEKYSLYAGAALGVLSIILLFFKQPFLGIISIIAGIGLVVYHFSKKKKNEEQRQNIVAQFEQKLTSGTQVIRATLAEVVDFRAEFVAKDRESEQVIAFLDQISPEQYVRKLADSNRRMHVSN